MKYKSLYFYDEKIEKYVKEGWDYEREVISFERFNIEKGNDFYSEDTNIATKDGFIKRRVYFK